MSMHSCWRCDIKKGFEADASSSVFTNSALCTSVDSELRSEKFDLSTQQDYPIFTTVATHNNISSLASVRTE